MLRVMTPMLQKISVFQVTQTVFSSICDRVLGGIQTSSGWTQVIVVYNCCSDMHSYVRGAELTHIHEAFYICSHNRVYVHNTFACGS